jgi:hypothetical protein
LEGVAAVLVGVAVRHLPHVALADRGAAVVELGKQRVAQLSGQQHKDWLTSLAKYPRSD